VDLDKLFEKLPYDRLYPIPGWQRMAGLAGISLVVVGLVYWLLISGQGAQIDQLQETLNGKLKEVRTNEQLAKRKVEFERKIAELSDKLSEAKKVLPEGKEIPRLLEQISHFGTQSGLEFDTFQPTKTTTRDFYAEVPVALKVYGKYHNILTFFDEISHMDRIVTINNVRMTQNRKKGKKSKKRRRGRLITLECDAITYRYIEGSEKAKNPKDASRKAARGRGKRK